MQKLSLAEKQKILAGFAKKGSLKTTTSNKFKWNASNVSLVALSAIPSIWMIIEGIISLSTKRPTNNFSSPYRGRSSFYRFNYQDSRRDFYAYASQAYRPSLRLTPYPSKNSINFGLPWLV